MNDLIDSVRTEGDMKLNGDSIFDATVDVIELRKRMGMVFQNFGLVPHFTALQNIAFPLKVQKRSKAQIVDRVAQMVEMVGLDGHAEGGGQIGRAGGLQIGRQGVGGGDVGHDNGGEGVDARSLDV